MKPSASTTTTTPTRLSYDIWILRADSDHAVTEQQVKSRPQLYYYQKPLPLLRIPPFVILDHSYPIFLLHEGCCNRTLFNCIYLTIRDAQCSLKTQLWSFKFVIHATNNSNPFWRAQFEQEQAAKADPYNLVSMGMKNLIIRVHAAQDHSLSPKTSANAQLVGSSFLSHRQLPCAGDILTVGDHKLRSVCLHSILVYFLLSACLTKLRQTRFCCCYSPWVDPHPEF